MAKKEDEKKAKEAKSGKEQEQRRENEPAHRTGHLARRGASGGGVLQRDNPVFAVTSPFGFVRRMMEDMDRLLGDFGSERGLQSPGLLTRTAWLPEVDIFQREGELIVQADLPGLRPEDVRIEVRDDGTLVIEGERESDRETEEGGLYRMERSYGRFYREIALPDGIDPDNVNATFGNGVLEISAKLPEQRRGRQIPIGEGGKPREREVPSASQEAQPDEIH